MKNNDWVIKVYEFDTVAKTGRWVTWRHPDGGRNVARFGCFGKLKRFVKRHMPWTLPLGPLAPQGHNEVTKEYRTVVTAWMQHT